MNERSILHDEQGLTTVEYIIILFLIAVSSIAAWQEFGEEIEEATREASTEISRLG
ncbi:MAG: Flp family type IVb pilin [Myxococcota bacterium]